MSRADKRHSLIELRMVELPAGERLLGEVADVNPVRIELQPGEWIASVEMGSEELLELAATAYARAAA